MLSVTPYLSFDGRCEAAFEFYVKALGATINNLQRFRDAPKEVADRIMPTGAEDKIMHGVITIGSSVVMASDGTCGESPQFSGIQLSLSPETDAQAQQLFAALAEGGTVVMPMQPTFWTSMFGMLVDRFGVPWMVNVDSTEHES